MVLRHGNYGSGLAAAAYWGRKQCVEILTKAGAEVSRELQNGRFGTALQASRADVTEEDLRRSWDSRDKERTRQEKDEVTALILSGLDRVALYPETLCGVCRAGPKLRRSYSALRA